MLTHEDYALKPTELDRINRLIATQSKAMWDGGETSDGLSLTFSFGPSACVQFCSRYRAGGQSRSTRNGSKSLDATPKHNSLINAPSVRTCDAIFLS